MPYPDGNPTIAEVIDERIRIRRYTDDLFKEGHQLARENHRLRTILERCEMWFSHHPDGVAMRDLCREALSSVKEAPDG